MRKLKKYSLLIICIAASCCADKEYYCGLKTHQMKIGAIVTSDELVELNYNKDLENSDEDGSHFVNVELFKVDSVKSYSIIQNVFLNNESVLESCQVSINWDGEVGNMDMIINDIDSLFTLLCFENSQKRNVKNNISVSVIHEW